MTICKPGRLQRHKKPLFDAELYLTVHKSFASKAYEIIQLRYFIHFLACECPKASGPNTAELICDAVGECVCPGGYNLNSKGQCVSASKLMYDMVFGKPYSHGLWQIPRVTIAFRHS